jgi:hypothetical protein
VPVDAQGTSPRQASYTVFRAYDNREYVSIELIIEVDPTWKTDTDNKFWTKAVDISNTAVLTGYLSN